MNEKLKELRSIEELERALEESKQRPVLLFKHSLTCPISSRAYKEFKAYLEEADTRVSYNLITVQTSRPVSNETAARLHIAHESPQAILVHNGQPVWNASHFGITAASLSDAVRRNAG